MTTREDTSTYNLLHQTISDLHPILGETFYMDTHNRNNTLKQRLLERESDKAVNLPIKEFRYSKCTIYFTFMYTYNI